MSAFHPDLKFAFFIPRVTFGRFLVTLMRKSKVSQVPKLDDLDVEDIHVPGPLDDHPVLVRVYRPSGASTPVPAMLWIHGGGMEFGNRTDDEEVNIAIARQLNMTVVSVEYRLSPEHLAPAALDDCYAALAWMFDHASELNIDPTRIAISGGSAGGGLAAGVTLMAHDRGQYRPAFQQLLYPMLDDRTALRTDVDPRYLRFWSAKSNKIAWGNYLGTAPGGETVSPYAAPARRADLSKLPRTWIGVGTLDLFYNEDVSYAERLKRAGTPTELVVVPGAFHGFDMFKNASVVKRFTRARINALEAGLLSPEG